MTKKYIQTRKLINENIKKYRSFLNLDEWEITAEFIDAYNEDPHVVMNMTTDISYLRATLRVFKPTWEKCDHECVKGILIHELCHIITEPMYSLCRGNVNPHLYHLVEEQREQETERIARIAQKALGL